MWTVVQKYRGWVYIVYIPCPAVVWIRSIEDEFEGAGDILVTDWNGVGFVAVAKLLSGGGDVTAGLGTGPVPGDFGGLSPVFSCLMLLFRLKLFKNKCYFVVYLYRG